MPPAPASPSATATRSASSARCPAASAWAGLAAAFSESAAPWLVILDEPTNHLDIESVECLEEALRRFDGALLTVSHDPLFLERIGIQRLMVV